MTSLEETLANHFLGFAVEGEGNMTIAFNLASTRKNTVTVDDATTADIDQMCADRFNIVQSRLYPIVNGEIGTVVAGCIKGMMDIDIGLEGLNKLKKRRAAKCCSFCCLYGCKALQSLFFDA